MRMIKSNEDSYHGLGKIWEIAKRHNKKSREINGEVTVTVKRKSTNYERLALT